MTSEIIECRRLPASWGTDNEYEGVYKSVDPSGTQADKEVVVFVSGNQLTWNQESAVWEKQ